MKTLLPHLFPGRAPESPAASAATFPRVTPDLVEALLERFPDRLPAPDADLGRVRFLQGQVSVVAYLAAICRAQRAGTVELKIKS